MIDSFFDRVVCVSLERRGDRWQALMERLNGNWPFRFPEKISAIDGKLATPPRWWTQGPGAWGCYRSHLSAIERALQEGTQRLLLLEDDALPVEGFSVRAESFLSELPSDWDMLYLGGQHLFAGKHPPRKVTGQVYQAYNVNRTHAFAISKRALRRVYQHLCSSDWHRGHHIDHHLGRLHMQPDFKVYCPREWLVGQAQGRSNISGRVPPDRFWPAAEKLASLDTAPFVAVIGLHSSGSSCLAGVLHHLGIHLGNHLGGYYGNDPNSSCGFEAAGLAQLCEAAIPFPEREYRLDRATIYSRLKRWIRDRQREAVSKNTIAGGKYPHLCRLGDQLLNICGESLRVVHARRPIEESIQSLQRRSSCCPKRIARHQRWLEQGKDDLLSRATHVLDVDYSELLSSPGTVTETLCEFLELTPSDQQLQRAVASVDPSKRHVTGASA